jgi:hypothetical protein
VQVFANARTGRHQQFVLRFSHASCSPKRHGGRDSYPSGSIINP